MQGPGKQMRLCISKQLRVCCYRLLPLRAAWGEREGSKGLLPVITMGSRTHARELEETLGQGEAGWSRDRHRTGVRAPFSWRTPLTPSLHIAIPLPLALQTQEREPLTRCQLHGKS